MIYRYTCMKNDKLKLDKLLQEKILPVTLKRYTHDQQQLTSPFPQKWLQTFYTSYLPYKQVSNLEHYSIIMTELHSHLIRMQKSHLRGTSLGEDINIAILYCRTKWISKCFHTYYHIFMFFYIGILLQWIGLCNTELSRDTSSTYLVMKLPAVE